MRDTNLVNALREHAEWAEGNQWETPITLGDDLAEAADRIANQNTHIAALQQKIEKLRGQMPHWIPVTERLPEDRGDVLVVAYWHERWGVYMGWCVPESAKWHVYVGIWDRNDVAVTHWMPLPEPPEVENAETK